MEIRNKEHEICQTKNSLTLSGQWKATEKLPVAGCQPGSHGDVISEVEWGGNIGYNVKNAEA